MKLSLDALKERAEATASNELLAAITGGNENSCHTAETPPPPPPANSSSLSISVGVSAPVGGQPTFTGTITYKFW